MLLAKSQKEALGVNARGSLGGASIRRVLFSGALVSLVLLGAGPLATSAQATVIPIDKSYTGSAKREPEFILVGSISRVEKMRWRSWRTFKARGVGRYLSCSITTSRCTSIRVRVTAGDREYCPSNRRYTFTRLKIIPLKKSAKANRAGLPVTLSWRKACWLHGPLGV